MTRSFTIPFVGVLAVFGFAQPTFGDHTCAEFSQEKLKACFSSWAPTFCEEQVIAAGVAAGWGVTINENMGCETEGVKVGTCTGAAKPVGPKTPAICFNLDAVSEGLCATLSALTCPTVSQWGMTVMALLVITTGTIVFTRRRAMVST